MRRLVTKEMRTGVGDDEEHGEVAVMGALELLCRRRQERRP